MHYSGTGFLAVVGFGLAPSPSPIRKLDRRHTGRLRMRDNLLMGERGEGGGGAKLYDGEKGLVLYIIH
jgi:hypothetical protein